MKGFNRIDKLEHISLQFHNKAINYNERQLNVVFYEKSLFSKILETEFKEFVEKSKDKE